MIASKKIVSLANFWRPKLRSGLILAVYLLLFVFLDLLTRRFQVIPGVVPWYPPDGLSFALLLSLGEAYAPALLLASLISSFFIYQLPQPPVSLIAWAFVVALIYGLATRLLRRRVRVDPLLPGMRDVLYLMLSACLISTLLAVVSVSASVAGGQAPPSKWLVLTAEWWMGEMIGILVLTPLLLIHVMPRVKRFADGRLDLSRGRISFLRPGIKLILQAISIPAVLYLVFVAPSLHPLESVYFLALPIIWIALDSGLRGASIAIPAVNFGVILASWVLRLDTAAVGELQLFMLVISATGLLIGAVRMEQLHATQALGQSEQRFRALIENNADAISLLDAQGIAIYDSPAAPGMLGYAPGDLIGRNAFELMHPDDLPHNLDMFQQLLKMRAGRVQSTFRLQHKDGSWRWIEAIATNLLGEPSVRAIVVNYRDISERKQAEAARDQSETLFRALFEFSPEAILLIDPHDPDVLWPIIDCNLQACQMNGYRHDELVGRSIDVINATPGTRPERNDSLKELKATGVRFREGIHRHKNGTLFPIEYSSTLITIGGRELILGIDRDITQRKQAEQALRASEEHYRLLFENNPLPMWVYDAETFSFLAVNDAAIEHYGYTRDEFLGMTIKEIRPPEELPALLNNLTAPRARSEKSGPWKHLKKDGTLIDVEIYSHQISFSGKPARLVLVSDITERKRAEIEIRRRLADFEAVDQLSRALRVAGTLEEMLPILLNVILGLLNTMAGSIWLHDETKDELYPALTQGYGEEQGAPRPLPEKLNEGINGYVFTTGEIRVSRDYHVDPGLPERVRRQIPPGIGGAVLPLRAAEKIIGTMVINVALPREFNADEIRLLTTLSEIAGNAIQRTRLQGQTNRRLRQLTALSEIDQAITASFGLEISLGIALGHVTAQLGVDAADVLLFSPVTHTLTYAAGRGFRTQAFEHSRGLRLGEGYAGKAALERRSMHVPNLGTREDNPRLQKALPGEAFVSYYGVPLIAKGSVVGVLEVFHRASLEADKEWLDFLQTLAGQVAIAIDNANLFHGLQHSNIELTMAYDATIEGWSHALDLRDRETEGHTQRVTNLTVRLAALFGLSDEALVHIRRGALLHDIGKMGVPDGILLKPASLTDEEWVTMRKHPQFAFDMLAPIRYLQPALDIPYCHHEKWDGTGYPRGLKGEQIPLAARIFAVVDVWDALTSDRPYRAAWSEEKALGYVKSQAGKHFDPQVLDVCLDSGLLVNQKQG